MIKSAALLTPAYGDLRHLASRARSRGSGNAEQAFAASKDGQLPCNQLKSRRLSLQSCAADFSRNRRITYVFLAVKMHLGGLLS
jgi:hypothetical protein